MSKALPPGASQHSESDLLAVRLTVGGGTFALLLAAIGFWFVSHPFTYGFLVGAVVLFLASFYIEAVGRIRVGRPFVIYASKNSNLWHGFWISSVSAILIALVVSSVLSAFQSTEQNGHYLVDAQPEKLMGFYRQNTAIQADKMASVYIGKWTKISGSLGDLQRSVLYWMPVLGELEVFLRYPDSNGRDLMLLRFSPSWEDRLDTLQIGTQIIAICQIEKIYLMGIWYKNCELPAREPPPQQTSVSTTTDDSRWESLNPSQIMTLASRVKLIPPHSIVVACENVNCRDLADNFATALNSGGWKASPLHSGGFGITGVMGLRIDQAGPAALALQQAIEDTTGLKVVCIPVPETIPEPETLNLVVGAKPF